MGRAEDLGDLGWMDRPFNPDDPDGAWLIGELQRIAGKGKALKCGHCDRVVAIAVIVAERQEYCSCGAAWYMDGHPCRIKKGAS